MPNMTRTNPSTTGPASSNRPALTDRAMPKSPSSVQPRQPSHPAIPAMTTVGR